MTPANPSLTNSDQSEAEPQYTSEARRGPSRRRRDAPGPGQRVRVFYFSLSSIWGFAVGASSVAAGVRLSGGHVGLDFFALGLMGIGLTVAVVGGAMAAAAYREARYRGGR